VAEIKSLNRSNVLLAGEKFQGKKWIYAMKYEEEGNIIKRKEILVAQGFQQVFGVNFGEEYAPVTTRMDTLQLVFSYQRSWV